MLLLIVMMLVRVTVEHQLNRAIGLFGPLFASRWCGLVVVLVCFSFCWEVFARVVLSVCLRTMCQCVVADGLMPSTKLGEQSKASISFLGLVEDTLSRDFREWRGQCDVLCLCVHSVVVLTISTDAVC